MATSTKRKSNNEIPNGAEKRLFSNCELIYCRNPEKSVNRDFKIILAGPTRGRPELCIKSISSFIEKSKNPENLKLLLGFDNDDKSSHHQVIDFIKENYPKIDIEVYEFEREGYLNAHKYQNTLINQAPLENNPWIFLWTDDLIMLKDDWDDRIISNYNENDLTIVYYSVRSGAGAGREIAYFFTSLILKITNFLLLFDPASDRFVREIAKATGIFRRDDHISISHPRPDDSTFQTAYSQRADKQKQCQKFNFSEEVIKMILEFNEKEKKVG